MRSRLSKAGGKSFALVFRAIKSVRPQRPIHNHGASLVGTISRNGTGPQPSGIAWVDTPGTDAVVGRFSRSLGLPQALPDILGLALRLSGAAPTDILLASTGHGVPGRFFLTAHRHAGRAAFTSMMPYQGANGPVLLAARTLTPDAGPSARMAIFRGDLKRSDWVLGLYAATPSGPWNRFGTLTLQIDPDRADTAERFDPVLHPLPGAGTYAWTRQLREPSYLAARQRKEP